MTDMSLILPQNFTTPEVAGRDLFIAPMTPDMTFSDSVVLKSNFSQLPPSCPLLVKKRGEKKAN